MVTCNMEDKGDTGEEEGMLEGVELTLEDNKIHNKQLKASHNKLVRQRLYSCTQKFFPVFHGLSDISIWPVTWNTPRLLYNRHPLLHRC